MEFIEKLVEIITLSKKNQDMQNKLNPYHESEFNFLNDKDIKNLKNKYKIIEVPWLSFENVNYEIFADKYFNNNPQKKEVINNMLFLYLNDEKKAIYKKTDYLCNEREQLCICNTNADAFRKIYDGINYKPENRFISWCKKKENHF